jgi:hypothetical protein
MILDPVVVPPGHSLKVVFALPGASSEEVVACAKRLAEWARDPFKVALVVDDSCRVMAFVVPDGGVVTEVIDEPTVVGR